MMPEQLRVGVSGAASSGMRRAMRKLDCSDAFELSEGDEGLGLTHRALRVRPRVPINCVELARGEEQATAPIEFEADQGREPCDLIGTTSGTLVLVSQRLVELLRNQGFNGWGTFPVRVGLGNNQSLDGYYGFAVTGRCGPIDDSLSEEVTLPPPVPGGRSSLGLRGLCFAPETWDGSDIFTADGYSGIFVVQRVKEALEGGGVTNVALQRLSEIDRDWRSDGSLVGD